MLGTVSGDPARCYPRKHERKRVKAVFVKKYRSAEIKISCRRIPPNAPVKSSRGSVMKRSLLIAGSLLLSTVAFAGRLNLADYPLRVHVFAFNGAAHYRGGSLDQVDGDGRANLYENGEPKGFDFSYVCGTRLNVSPGFETYPARWKKPGKTMEIILPVFGKPDAGESCELKVLMKDSAYVRRNGLIGEEPIAVFKDWMVKHKYDPEHGLNQPENSQPSQNPAAQTSAGESNPR